MIVSIRFRPATLPPDMARDERKKKALAQCWLDSNGCAPEAIGTHRSRTQMGMAIDWLERFGRVPS